MFIEVVKSSPTIPWKRGETIVVRDGAGKAIEKKKVVDVRPIYGPDPDGGKDEKLVAFIVTMTVTRPEEVMPHPQMRRHH